MKKTKILLQVRSNSSRLPGKAFLYFKGEPLFIYIAKRLQRSGLDVCVVTSKEKSDQAIFSFCRKNEIEVFRGELNNVYKRMRDYLVTSDSKYFVRLTGDNPLIDPSDIKAALNYSIANDLIVGSSRTWIEGKMMRTLPKGCSIDVFQKAFFIDNNDSIISDFDKEHVITGFKDQITLLPKSIFAPKNENDVYSIDNLDDYLKLITSE
ncbi:hypothetical protein [uncultured Roseivirga sp.]|uniref:cytidylyltransferase domain-containing protein n=1 Tax=uncultured Roseivirga sp. TaxID=543088 RepID=UPI000D7A75BD|nr:hypothetical protein [uncultured Roseivirga sp.]PWL30927.1 MAG: hypothetical protein DCO95_05475 [Roseivirga sp. XM-24bin3]